jgi:hypothetical protein
MWVGTVALAYASARGLFGRATRLKDAELRGLAEALAVQAVESIENARPKLDRGSARLLPEAPRAR